MTAGVSASLAQNWNALIALLPDPHLLQTWEWGQVKARLGWQASPLVWHTAPDGRLTLSDYTQLTTDVQPLAAALLLQRTLPLRGFAARLRLLYIPKGPLLNWSNVPLRRRVLNDLQALAHRRHAIFIKIDPHIPIGYGLPASADAHHDPLGLETLADLQARRWRFSEEQIQFRNTLLIDLSLPEETLLAQMKQKTRYNIRLAERKGVSVRVGGPADFALLYRMYAETSLRDGFVIRDEAYYRTVWGIFSRQDSPSAEQPLCEPLIAEVNGEAAAAVVIFRFAGRAYYLHGMSRQVHRDKMPNHLLQWEAMRRAKASGCRLYDLWGAPDTLDESDSMWGVYRFKEGLGGRLVQTIGAWDFPAQPLFYRLYTHTLPRLLAIMRRRGTARTRQIVGGA